MSRLGNLFSRALRRIFRPLTYFLTPGMLLMLLPGVMLLQYTLITRAPQSKLIVSFALSALFVLWCWSWFYRVRISYQRSLPQLVRRGRSFAVIYRARNLRKLTAYNVEFDPGLARAGLRVKHPALADELPPDGNDHTIRSEVIAERRGIYHLKDLEAVSYFPFGLFKSHAKRIRQPGRIVVAPDYQLLQRVDLPRSQRYARDLAGRVSKVGEADDFSGCRLYRIGDNPRHIHWRTSARRGTLTVREFKNFYIWRTAVLLDTCPTASKLWQINSNIRARHPDEQSFFRYFDRPNALLEAGIMLAASLTEYFSQEEFVVDLFAAGQKFVRGRCGRGQGCQEDILELLAGVEATPTATIADIDNDLLSELQAIGAVVVILLYNDTARRQMIEKLRTNGIPVKVILIGTKSTPTELPVEWQYFTAEQIASGGVKHL